MSTINIDMPCVDNKDLIYNVKELPETFAVSSGDLLLIETDEGTNIMDFDNFVIGLDNTTFGTTITEHSTDINTLSADVSTLKDDVTTITSSVAVSVSAFKSDLIGSTTKAIISLSAQDVNGPQLINSTNITSVEFENNKIRFNFSENLQDTNYLVLVAASVRNDSNEIVQFVESERQTNYLDLSAINLSDGSLATSATTLGFQIQTF